MIFPGFYAHPGGGGLCDNNKKLTAHKSASYGIKKELPLKRLSGFAFSTLHSSE